VFLPRSRIPASSIPTTASLRRSNRSEARALRKAYIIPLASLARFVRANQLASLQDRACGKSCHSLTDRKRDGEKDRERTAASDDVVLRVRHAVASSGWLAGRRAHWPACKCSEDAQSKCCRCDTYSSGRTNTALDTGDGSLRPKHSASLVSYENAILKLET